MQANICMSGTGKEPGQNKGMLHLPPKVALREVAKNRSLRGKFKMARRMISLGACAKIDFGASPYELNLKRSAKSTISTTKRARGISPDPSLPTANLPCAVTHKKVDSESVFFTN